MLKSYYELSEDLKEQAREIHPNDYEDWSYKTIGVEIEFSCRAKPKRLQTPNFNNGVTYR